jgi:hypothetical protein
MAPESPRHAPDVRPHAGRTRRVPCPAALGHLVAGVIALALPIFFAPASTIRSSSPLTNGPQVAKNAQPSSRHSKLPDDRNDDADVWSHRHRSAPGTGSGSSPAGYNAQHIKSFWNHYHSPRPEPKAKPLEREK